MRPGGQAGWDGGGDGMGGTVRAGQDYDGSVSRTVVRVDKKKGERRRSPCVASGCYAWR